MRKLVKPAGRFCVDILTGQNDRASSVVIESMVDSKYRADDGATEGL